MSRKDAYISPAADAAASELDALRIHLAQSSLASSHSAPLKGRDGLSVPWMFYSWQTTLNGDGLRLAGLALLARLRASFRSTQLASSGFTSLPLVSACVLLGGEEFTAIAVRPEPKQYGSCRQIEGIGDKSRLVVVVDDSISSGTSFRKTAAVLEAEGYEVEGVLCLVNFPERGGIERAQALGYRAEYLFDIWRDLEMPLAPYQPAWKRVRGTNGTERIHGGQGVAQAAREVASLFLETGRIPLPPPCFDRNYSAPGGVYVSFRDRKTERRLARDGFWHFDANQAELPRDLVLATVKTVRSARGRITLANLADLKIGVTLLGKLENVEPRQLDFANYGVAVRARANPWKTGGALPNTQVFTSEFEQYRHARLTNARVTDFEAHDLYRHTVQKLIEPGETWPSYGAPDGEDIAFQRDEKFGERLLSRVEQLLRIHPSVPQDSVDFDTEVPVQLYGVCVSLYSNGLAGCSVAWDDSIDRCLQRATHAARADRRFGEQRDSATSDDFAFTVTLLFEREYLGSGPPDPALLKPRIGMDALGVCGEEGSAIFLPCVGVHFCWGMEKLAANLLRKARINSRRRQWFSFRSATWLKRNGGCKRIEYGFPVPVGTHECPDEEQAWEMGEYIAQHVGQDGLPAYCYFPVQDIEQQFGTSGRVVHAIHALHQAGRKLGSAKFTHMAEAGLETCLRYVRQSEDGTATLALPSRQNGAMADAQLLISLASAGWAGLPVASSLAARLRKLVRTDGRISLDQRLRLDADHDFLPGVVILALATYATATGTTQDAYDWQRLLAWYRRRFRLMHSWGIVGWHPQAWLAVAGVPGGASPGLESFIFEVADWALPQQSDTNGAFMTDLDPSGPSFHVAFILEGITAAWRLALARNDTERGRRYEDSWRHGMEFMRRLIIDQESTYCMKRPERCVGAVRANRQTSAVRIDFVSHTLLALLGGMENLQIAKFAVKDMEAI